MPTKLPINLQDLLRQRTVEGERIEYSRRYRNRRIGEFLKELDLTEGRSTGIPKILKVMAANGSPAPLFETDDERASFVVRLPVHALAQQLSMDVTDQVADQVADQVTEEVAKLLMIAARGEQARRALQDALGLKHIPHFREPYLLPALAAGYLEMTHPEQPNSRLQRYRLTERGRKWLQAHRPASQS